MYKVVFKIQKGGRLLQKMYLKFQKKYLTALPPKKRGMHTISSGVYCLLERKLFWNVRRLRTGVSDQLKLPV
jgi:hypothetical protein